MTTLILLSIAPMSEIAKVDFKNVFAVTASAISDWFTPNHLLGEIEANYLERAGNIQDDVLTTQATADTNLTVGDSVELYVAVKDKDGNDANVGACDFRRNTTGMCC